jgi:subtilisin family serine protease
MRSTSWLFFLLVLSFSPTFGTRGQDQQGKLDFWAARDVAVRRDPNRPLIRIGIWDSGVDTELFKGRLATDRTGTPILRGYDSFKRRQDTPMELLPDAVSARRDELNAALKGFDDLDSNVDSEAARAVDERMKKMTAAERAAFSEAVDRWSGFAHGTAVADIALAGNDQADIIVARMEWWHGSPPVPCWTRELADREAESIRDLLSFLVKNGARVVNMSWGRAETAYLRNLEKCAPQMAVAEREGLARYTVEKIRSVLMAGMRKSPNVLFVGAAGNQGTSVQKVNPATRFSLPNFLLIGAVDRNGGVADFTNTGAEVTLYANGDRVAARLPGGDVSFPSGTSMATPNVANAAAKMLVANLRLTGAQLKELLERTADTNATGQRLLHTAKAVDAARAASTAHAGDDER